MGATEANKCTKTTPPIFIYLLFIMKQVNDSKKSMILFTQGGHVIIDGVQA